MCAVITLCIVENNRQKEVGCGECQTAFLDDIWRRRRFLCILS